MNLQELMNIYHEEGLTRELAAARVCQDIVLKGIADGPLCRNVTIKGGVVMRSLTQNNRRATRDIDLDFIHYSLNEEAMRIFVDKLNCIEGLDISIEGDIVLGGGAVGLEYCGACAVKELAQDLDAHDLAVFFAGAAEGVRQHSAEC